MYVIKERDVIRVKVKFCDNEKDPQIKKFAIDPRLTNFDVLIGLLVKGLQIKSREFVIHYLATDDFGEQFYLPLLSDWDLDAAILTASDPILRLKVNLKQKEKGKNLEEWDIVVPGEVPLKLGKNNISSKSLSNLFRSLNMNESGSRMDKSSSNFLNQFYQSVEKTFSTFNRVFSNKMNESIKPLKAPMSDIEFRNYMDNIGRIVQPDEFRRSVYLGGLEPSLRKVGWRLLLNVYPEGLTGRERLNLLEQKTRQYMSLKESWKERFKYGKLTEREMAQLALVSVDVIRTDRSLNYYGAEKNYHHICQLFDILATYCIYHPSVGYYQGMSDLASPLLFVQSEEAVAYLCFCSLMQRVSVNFTGHQTEDGGLVNKLSQLFLLIRHLDPQLADFMQSRRISNCHFAHRWILLEMKREFPFSDSLRILEVQWAALTVSNLVAGNCAKNSVPLVEKEENCLSPSAVADANGSASRSSKVRCYAVRDMSLLLSLMGHQYAPIQGSSSSPTSIDLEHFFNGRSESVNNVSNTYSANHSIPHSSSANEMTLSSVTSEMTTTTTSSRRSSFSDEDDCGKRKINGTSSSVSDTKSEPPNGIVRKRNRTATITDNSAASTSLLNEKSINIFGENVVNENNQPENNVLEELPSPEILGCGNPLLLFICVSLVLEYRELIMRGVSEPSDMLMLFQRFSQRHSLPSVLGRAQRLFEHYLRDQEIKRRHLDDFPELHLSM